MNFARCAYLHFVFFSFYIHGEAESLADSLTKAAQLADVKEIQRIIQKGFNVNQKDTKGQTALVVAARAGNDQVVKALIQAGADVNLHDDMGNSPLHSVLKNCFLGGNYCSEFNPSHNLCRTQRFSSGAQIF